MQTRREFLITTTACALVTTATPVLAVEASRPPSLSAAPLLEADPYTCHLDEHGLGGRSFDAALEHALRFRSTPEDRDRFVLGLEV